MKHTKLQMMLVCMGLLSSQAFVEAHATENQSMNSSKDYQATEKLYNSMLEGDEPNVAKLNLFFTRMPKGGDLHHHYTGSIYAETYLDWVSDKGWWIDSCTLEIVKVRKELPCKSISVQQLLSDNDLYRKLLTLWSDKDYKNHFHNQPSPDTNFFNTFGFFSPISNEYMNIGLDIIKQRAINENVTYIETMLTRVGARSKAYFDAVKLSDYNSRLRKAKSQEEVNLVLDEVFKTLQSGNESNAFNAQVKKFVDMVKANHQGIDGKNFVMRYQTYAVRVLDPMQVFVDLLSGYLAADTSDLVVGVNIVAPENNSVALTDYTLHMQMYSYLLGKYPKVNRALHAGELTLGMVRPKDLLFHIKQARGIAQAQRIGHGVDLPYEDNSLELLEDLKQHAVVEINLTSNEFILGVEKNKHPYLVYSAYGVPLIISTDDSGVSRNNLSNEYVLLASRYKPGYERIKEYVYNSLKYSFLEPDEKETGKKLLDKKFRIFEKEMATLF